MMVVIMIFWGFLGGLGHDAFTKGYDAAIFSGDADKENVDKGKEDEEATSKRFLFHDEIEAKEGMDKADA